MRRLLLFIVSVVAGLSCWAQIDTEFWFACPDLSASHFQTSIRLCVTTFDQPATITVEQPANPSFKKITHFIAADSYINIPLGSLVSQVETQYGAVRKTALLIRATAKVTAYYANYADNSEIYALKGRNALGTFFNVPTQYMYDNSETYGGSSSVEVLATEDNTDVTIVPSHACLGYAANQPIQIKLNRGEAYAIRAKGMTALSHLFNTTVQATKPVAVNYTDDGAAGPGVDLVGDQLVPLDLVGDKYIAIRYAGQVEELYIFPASADSTTVYVNGQSIGKIRGMGDVTKTGKLRYVLGDGATYVTADHPIIVLQITSNGTELGGAILPAINCSGSNEISYKYTQSSGASFGIVTKTENINSFAINGDHSLLPGTYFSVVPGNPEWSYTFKAAVTNDMMRVSNSKGLFHLAVIDKPGTTCSLGYFTNYNTYPIGATSDKTYYLSGDKVTISIEHVDDFENLQWTGPNGFTATGESFVLDNVQCSQAGPYVATASHKEGCPVEPDTLWLEVFTPTATRQTVCSGRDTMLLVDHYRQGHLDSFLVQDTLYVHGVQPLQMALQEMPTICLGDPSVTVQYSLLSGQIDSFLLRFDSVALQKGMTNRQIHFTPEQTFDIPLSAALRPGYYNASLDFGEQTCDGMTMLPFVVTVHYNADSVIAQRWNDVLAVRNADFNGGYTFTAYQWYCNGQPIAGADSSVYYAGPQELDRTAQYSVELTTPDQVVLSTCPFMPTDVEEAHQPITLLSSYVAAGQRVALRGVSVKGMVTVYDTNGRKVTTEQITSQSPSFTVPNTQGLYFATVQCDQQQAIVRFIVQ